MLCPLALLLPACVVYDEELVVRAPSAGAYVATSGDKDADAGSMPMSPSAAPSLIREPAAAGADAPNMLSSAAGAGGTGGFAGARAPEVMPSRAPDACPNDPKKTAPGVCGCGTPDTDSAEAAGCAGLRAAIRHRYSFDGMTKVVRDTVGMADAVVEGATLHGEGRLRLQPGTPAQYVALPGALLTGLDDVTIEVWVSWEASADPGQIFEFANDSIAAEGNSLFSLLLRQITAGERDARVFYLATMGEHSAHPHVGLLVPGMREISLDATVALQPGRLTHLAVVSDLKQQRLRLFMHGTLNAEVALSIAPASLEDMYDWLGSSPNATDRNFSGSLHEFRIYAAALSAAQIATSFAAGPDASFL
jgi:hypothetical protein